MSDARSTAASDREFTSFVREKGLAFARLATLLSGGQVAGEDLLQGVLEKTYLRWSRAGGIEDPEAYVRTALVNAARNLWRHRARRPERLMSQPPDSATAGTDTVVERRVLFAALSRLSAQQRAVIVLRYFEDLSEATVAQVLGCSVGTVKKQASRGLERLRGDRDLANSFGELEEWAHD